MKTYITIKNYTKELVRHGLNNAEGMTYQDTPEMREAVKNEIQLILSEIQGK